MAAAGDKASLSDVAGQLARRWATQRLAAVQSYGRILADYGQGRSTGRAALGAFAKLAAEEAVRYPSDAIGIATDYAAAVAKQAGVDLGVAKTAVKAAPPIRDLELSGPLGGEAFGAFFLRNPHDRAVMLSFFASNFAGSAGEAPASVMIDPAEVMLAAGEEQEIRVAVALDGAVFEAGQSYSANVAVSGFDEMVLRVRLTVLEPG
jgi:hypothetical protein